MMTASIKVYNRLKLCNLVTMTILVTYCLSFSMSSQANTIFDERFKSREKKALAGDAVAQYRIGLAYLRGSGVQVNIKVAKEWFRKSSRQGYARATHKLGMLYYLKKYGMKNNIFAHRLFLRAAKKNHFLSQYYVSLTYLEGIGTSKDLKSALRWATKAKRNGVYQAKTVLENIKQYSSVKTRTKPAGGNTQIATTTKVVKNNRIVKKNRVIKKVSRHGKNKLFRSAQDTLYSVLNGRWKMEGTPAQHMPSILNNCYKSGKVIKCVSEKIHSETDDFSSVILVQTTLSNFTASGTFSVKYRVNYVSVKPAFEDSVGDDELPKTGWQKSYTSLLCKYVTSRNLVCNSSNLTVERYTQNSVNAKN